MQVAAQLARQPERSFNAAFDSYSDQRLAAYRFVENDKIQVDDIVAGGVKHLSQLLRERPDETILACEDTTNISYLHASPREQLGPIGGPHNSKMQGFLVHSVLAFDELTGEPLGLLDQQYEIRAKGVIQTPQGQRAQSDRESYMWRRASERVSDRLGQAMRNVVFVCDREADIYSYFDYKARNQQRFVVRAKSNRRLEEVSDKLFVHLKSQPVRCTTTLELAQQHGRKARTCTMEVRGDRVEIKVPDKVKDVAETLTLWAVMLTEINPPAGVKALQMTLLTSEDCNDEEILLFTMAQLCCLGLQSDCTAGRLERQQTHRQGRSHNLVARLAAPVRPGDWLGSLEGVFR